MPNRQVDLPRTVHLLHEVSIQGLFGHPGHCISAGLCSQASYERIDLGEKPTFGDAFTTLDRRPTAVQRDTRNGQVTKLVQSTVRSRQGTARQPAAGHMQRYSRSRPSALRGKCPRRGSRLTPRRHRWTRGSPGSRTRRWYRRVRLNSRARPRSGGPGNRAPGHPTLASSL